MNATILLPSREKFSQFELAVQSLRAKASLNTNVEIIARVDADDPMLGKYVSNAGLVDRLIIGPRLTGYGSNHVFYEDCAKLSTGDVLVLWNDDMQMETVGWDLIYKSAFEANPLTPASAHISSPSEGRDRHYKWACAAISREMYRRMGSFAIGCDPSIDRCYESLARHLGREQQPEVWINHDYNHGFEGTRADHYSAVHREWGTRAKRWDQIGREFAAKLK